MTISTQRTLDARVAAALPPHRLERLEAWLEEERLDAAVVLGADNVNHLGGYSRYYGGPSGLVIGRDGLRTLVVMLDEVKVAERLSQADRVLGFGERGFGIELNPLPLLADVVAGVDSVASAGRLGVADGLGGMNDLLRSRVSAELVAAEGAMYRLRQTKDADELEKILWGYELSWLGQQAVREKAQSGEASEIELFTEALSVAQTTHGEPIGFLADLLSGPNTGEVCCPIHIASPRVAVAGDPIIADVVVGASGYWGDTADTHVVGQNAEIERARATLLGILATAGTELRPGATGAEIFRRMDARIREAFPGGEFPHHGGHALGLTSFEDPHVIPSDETPLEAGMVIAVEPGVYFAGRWGARVENVFVVTADGGVELREAFV
jgi:Xaa-Pro aminopeptidase